MKYVQRDGFGKITGVFANPQPGYAEEEMADDAPELLAHLNPAPLPPGDRVVAEISGSKTLMALVTVIAANLGKTEAAIMAEAKAAGDAISAIEAAPE